MATYAALGFGFTATGVIRKALQDAARDYDGGDPRDLRYVEKGGIAKIIDVKSGEIVRHLR